MATLLEKANQILAQKEANLLPENLKSGITCMGVEGTLIELQGEEKVIEPSIEEQVITPSEGKNGITQATVNPVTSAIDTNILPENIKSGVSILGVEGTMETGGIDTSDADAVANDIAENKTAYINGEKITGTLHEYSSDLIMTGENATKDDGQELVFIHANASQAQYIARIGFKPGISISFSSLAELIGLTPDKIKAGETILGVTGTYTGTTTE